ncbi:MAG: transposase [Rhodocyclaceae bacterium]|nr:transposase [Rhodocyclaceae bacterium]MCA3075053.1 transposase [Rhodocyclaceae bacterium]MCA3091183.1 transposase [Rhodocyclaceae bacterium]MCA3092345.1 transposase [Rhodocyclaceae bacterium]MCA3098453.1 transposase [Rhodocyclaceae bacterium]
MGQNAKTVPLTRIDGIDVITARAAISETGADMSRFPSDKHFASWMGLCPGNAIAALAHKLVRLIYSMLTRSVLRIA